MASSISDQLTKASFGTRLSLRVAQLLPNQVGYFAARQAGAFLSHWKRSAMVRSVMMNQWVIHGGRLSEGELMQHVHRTYAYQSRALFETYRYMDRPDRLGSLVSLSPRCRQVLNDQKNSRRGLVLLLPHLCGFDLGGFSLAQQGFPFLTLSYPNPPGGYQLQNELGRKHGMDVLPLSFSALKTARERLEKGGTVLTGLDRPYPESGYAPWFFGRPAPLPVSHIRMALKTHAAVRIIATLEGKNKDYIVDVSDEIPMLPDPDPHREVITNAERVLKEAEKFILFNPGRWVMFFPVWPEVAGEIPYLKSGSPK
jgi:KDO2-lipid IV(A) lauroyltransferase